MFRDREFLIADAGAGVEIRIQEKPDCQLGDAGKG